MGKLKIPVVVRDLDLGEYIPEYTGQVIQVWVNPPRAMLAEFDVLRLELIRNYEKLKDLSSDADPDQLQDLGQRVDTTQNKLFAWLSTIWSQGQDDDGHWSEAEIQELQALCMDDDPKLWQFLVQASYDLISDYRQDQKKV